MVLVNDNEDSRRAVEACYRRRKTVVNPIIDWEDEDVWEFIKTYNVLYCELYDQGYKRLGCIGCPMNTTAAAELDRYPKYKDHYLKAFQRMLDRYTEPASWETPQDVMDWWLQSEKSAPLKGQIDINELMEEE